MVKPQINVTPLIDVLLVLLIIFMVISPLKPSTFNAKVPAEPKRNDAVDVDPRTLVVEVGSDLTLSLNREHAFGSVNETGKLSDKLKAVFLERERNLALDDSGNVAKTVFIKAPRNIGYGSVAKVIDAVKIAGGEPISLQIDYLD